MFSWLWKQIAALRLRWIRPVRVGVPVVSVGNLAVGGTGKTPLVLLLAEQFQGKRVAVLARGYRAKRGELNDEMQLIAHRLPWVKLYQGKNRVQLAQQAVRDGIELILLDDGFQHHRLFRDIDVVVVQANDWRDRCLPFGRLREPVSALNRADYVVSYEPVPCEAIGLRREVIEPKNYGKVGIFCGIGKPEQFRDTVKGLGCEIVAELFVGDHMSISAKKLNQFAKVCVEKGATCLLCTEKDFVKLPKTDLPIRCIRIKVVVNQRLDIWQKLVAEIEQKLR
jgi:tetraacyldisaccharide 4'-kinase